MHGLAFYLHFTINIRIKLVFMLSTWDNKIRPINDSKYTLQCSITVLYAAC